MKTTSTSLLVAAGLLGFVTPADAAEFRFTNKCTYTINLRGTNGAFICDLAPNDYRDKNCGATITPGKSDIFRHTASNQVNLIEYSLNTQMWYDFSNIPPGPGNCNSYLDCKQKTGAVGYNVPMSLTPTKYNNNANCRTLVDMAPDAPDAYLFPADTKTHDCPGDEVFDVVFCPGGSGPAPAPSTSSSAPSTTPSGGSQPAGTCATQMDTDYPGNDIANAPLTGTRDAQVAQCCAKCSSTANCAVFTVAYNTCYMKSSKGTPKPASGLVSGTSTPSPSGTCTSQMNIDFVTPDNTNDIGNAPVSGSQTDQLAQCCAMCYKNPKCVVYTVGYGACYMKSSIGQPKVNNYVVSGIKGPAPTIQWNQDYWGNDLDNFLLPGSTVEQATMCRSACSLVDKCQGYTVNGGRCFLKSQLSNGYTSQTAYSGTKN